jgi:hypothetical protein
MSGGADIVNILSGLRQYSCQVENYSPNDKVFHIKAQIKPILLEII